MNKRVSSLLKKATLALSITTMLACGPTREQTQQHAPSEITFSGPKAYDMPNIIYAEKYGFGDVNGDGLEDFIQIEDRGIIQNDCYMRVHNGVNVNNVLQFAQEHYTIPLPLGFDWFSSDEKMDIADVNGDGFADVVFTNYHATLLGHDYVTATAAINQKDGKTFEYQSLAEKFDVTKNIDENVSSSGENHDIADDLKVDWADINGDGKDDLLLFADGGRALYVEARTSHYENNTWQLGSAQTTTLAQFMKSKSIKWLDTADYNGDKKADIMLYETFVGGEIHLSVALNDTVVLPSADNNISFAVQKDWKGTYTRMNIIGVEKADTFDANFDGRADFAYMGRKDGKRVISYNFSEKNTQ